MQRSMNLLLSNLIRIKELADISVKKLEILLVSLAATTGLTANRTVVVAMPMPVCPILAEIKNDGNDARSCNIVIV